MLNKTKSRPFSGKHIKTTLLAFALLFSVNALMAQERYDYATVVFNPASRKLQVSLNGTSSETIETEKSNVKAWINDVNPALKYINKMNDKDWELFDTETELTPTLIYIFYLRKKEQ